MSDTERAPSISDAEAQYCLLFTVVVAGKSEPFARAAMERFFAPAGDVPPYRWIKLLISQRRLGRTIRRCRMGCYKRLTRSFREIATGEPDLRTATPAELERYHGVGAKSSRFAIMWVRPHERYAALDTHVLKWLRFVGHDAPKSTPPAGSALYDSLERAFIAEADRRGFNPRLLDAMIWEHAANYAGGGRNRPDPTDWPPWLQRTPLAPPADVLAHFSYADRRPPARPQLPALSA